MPPFVGTGAPEIDASKLTCARPAPLPGGSGAGGFATFGFGRIGGAPRRPGRATAPAGGFSGLERVPPDREEAAPGCERGGGAGGNGCACAECGN